MTLIIRSILWDISKQEILADAKVMHDSSACMYEGPYGTNLSSTGNPTVKTVKAILRYVIKPLIPKPHLCMSMLYICCSIVMTTDLVITALCHQHALWLAERPLQATHVQYNDVPRICVPASVQGTDGSHVTSGLGQVSLLVSHTNLWPFHVCHWLFTAARSGVYMPVGKAVLFCLCFFIFFTERVIFETAKSTFAQNMARQIGTDWEGFVRKFERNPSRRFCGMTGKIRKIDGRRLFFR